MLILLICGYMISPPIFSDIVKIGGDSMTYIDNKVRNDIERWFSYGWEWRVIDKLLYQAYGIKLTKIEFLETIKKNQQAAADVAMNEFIS